MGRLQMENRTAVPGDVGRSPTGYCEDAHRIMTQKQLDDLYGNVVEHRSNNVFAVALNIGDECDASVPKPVAREVFRIVPGDPVTVRARFHHD